MNVPVATSLRTRVERRYVREPEPLFFPVAAEVPETQLHYLLCAYLYFLVTEFVGERGVVICDQFLYWDATDPRKCLAPDLAVRLGAPKGLVDNWKIWERGAPNVAVEVISKFDRLRGPWSDKLERYRCSGIDEVVRFDPRNFKRPLRLWDRFEGDLVERDLNDEKALLCDALGVYWCVKSHAEYGQVLRIARDPKGTDLIPTRDERHLSELAEIEQERAAKEAALARIAELEAELRRRG